LNQESYLSSAPTKPSSQMALRPVGIKSWSHAGRHLDAVQLQAHLVMDIEMHLEGNFDEGVGIPGPLLAHAIAKY